MHCFSAPGCSPPALERGWYVSFAGNVTYPKADGAARAAASVPADRLLAETDSPYLAPQPVRGRRTSRRTSCTRSRRSPRPAARTPTSSRPRSTRTRPPPSRCVTASVSEEAARPALPRGREHPRRDRPARRARRRTTSCSRSAPASASSPATSPTASRTSTRSSSTARSSRTSGARIARSRPALGRRARARPRRARAAADEARREPAVQHRHAARRREPRPGCRRSSSGA